MKRGSRTLATLALAAATAAGLPGIAHADRRDRHDHWRGDIRHFDRHDIRIWRGGQWHHGRHGGRLGWWWVVGGVWYFYPQPVYPFPNPYVPPVVVQQPPPVYVERPQSGAQPAPGAQPPATWYYCDQSRAYYPYVRACPGGWKPVPATPER